MVQYEITVKGRVQGVGFRYYTKKQAEIFNLKGWVKNTSTGNVLVMVQGEQAEINTFMDYLRVGPTLSRVTEVNKVLMQVTQVYTDFQIRH